MLREVNLAVDDGDLVVVVGPSGCGKSTCLRIATGLETPDAGVVRVGERDVTRTRPADRELGMVFQVPALLPHLDVQENVGFGLRVRRTPRVQMKERVASALALVGIEHLASRKPSGLSGGEGQLVALARAIVREPKAFLLDEPLSSLDAQVRLEMRRRIRDVQRVTGTAMLYVTHDQVEAMTLADRLAVLHDGVIVQEGTPAEVFDRPANRFVASFIGSPRMNLLAASLVGDQLVAGPFTVGVRRAADLSGDVEIGVRPEHVELTTGDDAEVRIVEVAGSEAFVSLEIDEIELTVRVPVRSAPSVGSRVGVRTLPSVFHVFADGVRVGPE